MKKRRKKTVAKTSTNPATETKPVLKQPAPATTETETDTSAKTDKAKTAKTDTTEKKKVVRKSNLPASYLAFSELGKNIVQNWPSVFPNLTQLPLYSLQQLNDAVNDFATNVALAQNLDNDKKANTVQLAKTNALINAGTTKLRQYVRDEFANPTDQAVQFAFYGLEKAANGLYILPTDNNSRKQALPRLIAHFTNSNFANRNFGLSAWAAAQAAHTTHWEESERLRSERSVLTSTLAVQFAKLKAIAKHVYQYIKVAFEASQVAARRREIGFLKESF